LLAKFARRPFGTACSPVIILRLLSLRFDAARFLHMPATRYWIAKRMNKKRQMRWNRTTVQPFLDVRTVVLNENLEDDFRHRYPEFRSINDDQLLSETA
jgi:hypothetical protein